MINVYKEHAFAYMKEKKEAREKLVKKVRHKAGWKEEDRMCMLCKKEITVEQALIRHHLQYKPDIVGSLHFVCHELAHARAKYNNPYTKKYGVDFGPIALAYDILKMYNPVKLEFLNKFPEFQDREFYMRG